MKKLLFIAVCLLSIPLYGENPVWLDSLFSLESGFSGNIIRKEGFNSDNYLNRRDLTFKIKGDIDLTLNPTNFWRIKLLLTSLVDNKENTLFVKNNQKVEVNSEFASFSFGFKQLYSEFFLNSLTLSIGKMPFKAGVSTFINPANYDNPLGAFWDERGSWLLSLGLSLGVVNLSIFYLPVFEFAHKNFQDEFTPVEKMFEWVQTPNHVQELNLDLGFFINPVDIHLYGYLKEKKKYNLKEGVYGAIALTFATPLGEHFKVYTEALLGNGLGFKQELVSSGDEIIPVAHLLYPPQWKWQDREQNKAILRGLIGVSYTPITNLEFTLEYYYNGGGLSSNDLQRLNEGANTFGEHYREDARNLSFLKGSTDNDIFSKPFELSQHFITFIINWRNIFNKLDILNVSSFALINFSLFDRLKVEFNISENLSIKGQCDFYLAQKGKSFSFVPDIANLGLFFIVRY